MPTPPALSIVIPFLNELASLPLLRQRLETLPGLPPDWELILVSDGSTDGSAELVEAWASLEPRVKLVRLTRNFGHQAALSAGLSYATGQHTGIMDADLQDPPEALLDMWRQAVNDGFDIVYAVRAKRKESLLKRAAYRIFYRLYRLLSETPVNMDSGDFCVMSRRAVLALVKMPEKIRFIRGLRSWLGLREKAVTIERAPRAAGQPQYSLGKLIRLALRGLTSFSTTPLRLATICGFSVFLLSILLSALYLAAAIVLKVPAQVPGFTTLVILLLFLHGLNFLLLGIIGEYLAQIFHEVKNRPIYLVDRTVNLPDRPDDPAK